MSEKYLIQESSDYGHSWTTIEEDIKSKEKALAILALYREPLAKKRSGAVRYRIDVIGNTSVEEKPDRANRVELLGYYGGDITHGLSAWTSTHRDLTEDKMERLPKMLSMLASEGHETPFEKSVQHFLVDTEMATHIQLIKHRIGVSINAESARYKELKEDKIYIPLDFYEVRVSDEHGLAGYNTWAEVLHDESIKSCRLYHACLKDVEKAKGRKRAKESARFFKMYNSKIASDVMFNWRSFAHFLYLRRSEHAQREICDVADKMLELVKSIPGNPFKHTIEAFGL